MSFHPLGSLHKTKIELFYNVSYLVSNEVIECCKVIDVRDIFTNQNQILDMLKDKNSVEITEYRNISIQIQGSVY